MICTKIKISQIQVGGVFGGLKKILIKIENSNLCWKYSSQVVLTEKKIGEQNCVCVSL